MGNTRGNDSAGEAKRPQETQLLATHAIQKKTKFAFESIAAYCG